MNKKIELYLDDINEYVNSTLLYLSENSNDLDKGEIIMYLSSVDEMITEIKNYLSHKRNYIIVNKKDLINYLYYLNDKVCDAYKSETTKSIKRFMDEI